MRKNGDGVLLRASLPVHAKRMPTKRFCDDIKPFGATSADVPLVARNDLGEHSNSMLAISNRQIFIRTFEHLWCIEET